MEKGGGRWGWGGWDSHLAQSPTHALDGWCARQASRGEMLVEKGE